MTEQTSTSDVIDVPAEPGTDLEPTVADLTPARVDHGMLVTAAAPAETIIAAFQEYQGLTERLLVADDYQAIEGKQFKKKSAYRKLSVAFGVSFEILERVHDRDEFGRIIRSEFTVRATAPNGRYMDGYGACGVWDRCKPHGPWKACEDGKCKHCGGREGGCDGFHHYSKPEHDVPATAETRAKNRAASDLFGMGEVSAEEVDTGDNTVRVATWDEIGALRKHCGEAVALGITKESIGRWPVVFGVALETEPDDVGNVYAAVSSQQVTELEHKLGELVAAFIAAADESGAGPEPAAPQGVVAAGEGTVGPEASSSESASKTTAAPAPTSATENGGVEAAAPVASPAPENDATSVASAPEPVESPAADGAREAVVETAAPPSPASDPQEGEAAAPTVEPVPSSAGERARFATLTGTLYPVKEHSERARHAMSAVVSSGRTRTSTQLTHDEITFAIKGAKLIGSGHLAFSVFDEAGALRVLAPGETPAEDETPTVVVTVPEGGVQKPGDDYMDALTAFLGAE